MAKYCTKPLPKQDLFMKDGSQRWVWNGIISRVVITTNTAFGLRLSLSPCSHESNKSLMYTNRCSQTSTSAKSCIQINIYIYFFFNVPKCGESEFVMA